MYWTELWVAILTAGLAYALWHQRRLARELREKTEGMAKALAFKQDKRPFTPKPRARRVDTVFHDRDDEGREHWLCVNCGASVPQMGHTVKACEEERAAMEETAKAAHGVATSGLEIDNPTGTPPNK